MECYNSTSIPELFVHLLQNCCMHGDCINLCYSINTVSSTYLSLCRTVCVHDCCLSPENAQLQLSQSNQSFHSFISVASCDNRKVITFHFIPCSKDVERDVSATLNQCGDTLIELIEILNLQFPELRRIFQHLLEPLFIEI